jgi:putative nucleotidyltransferase with HDIG domain
MKKCILFVDDEPNLLKGLERLLHPFRDKWDMVFVGDGETALVELEKKRFDVIVSDLGMPAMDGATLLGRVQEQFPRLVRMVLSGKTDQEAAMRAIAVAHQFLAKPCRPDELKEAVERACNLRTLLEGPALRSAIGGIRNLPSRPQVYTSLLQAIASPNSSLSQIAKIIEEDMALSAKILQLVNSAFFGLPRQISNLSNAVSYLGINMIKNLALSMVVFQTHEHTRWFPGFSLDDLQEHAMLTAKIAKRLLTQRREVEDAFAAGMLHDVGKLILASKLPDRFQQVLKLAREERRPLHLVEEEHDGLTHAEVGAYLLGLWGLPNQVVEAVAFHHFPQRVKPKQFDVLSAVYVANCLAHEHQAAGRGGTDTTIDMEFLGALGVADQLPKWRSMLEDHESIGSKEKVR